MKLGWKTLTGAAIWGAGALASPDAAGFIPQEIATVAQAIGGFLGMFGMRHAIAKGNIRF